MALKHFWLDGKQQTAAITYPTQKEAVIQFQEKSKSIRIISWNPQTRLLLFMCDNRMHKAHAIFSIDGPLEQRLHIYLFSLQATATIELQKPHTQKASSGSLAFKGNLTSPLSGCVTRILVNKTQKVCKDQPLLIIESMKMENEIRASHDVYVKTIPINEQDLVQSGQVLMTFATESISGE